MSRTIGRRAYAEMFGPTTGDRLCLADTGLVIEVDDRAGAVDHGVHTDARGAGEDDDEGWRRLGRLGLGRYGLGHRPLSIMRLPRPSWAGRGTSRRRRPSCYSSGCGTSLA